MFAGLDIWEAALIGAVLAPTDASLAQPVISDRRVPRVVRDGLNVESGLNDGIALPFVIIFLGLTGEATAGAAPDVLDTFLRALVLSALLGGLVGWLGGRLVTAAGRLGWIARTWRPLVLLATALLAYACATVVEGSGFIAAWVAGLAAGMATPRRRLGTRRCRTRAGPTFIDGLGSPAHHGQLPGLRRPAARPAARVVHAARPRLRRPGPDRRAHGCRSRISLIGSRLGRPTVLFVGWFGPRGLASIVFTVLIVDEALPGVPLITTIVAATVALSIVGPRRDLRLGRPSLRRLVRGRRRRVPSMPEAAEGVEMWRPSADGAGRHRAARRPRSRHGAPRRQCDRRRTPLARE